MAKSKESCEDGGKRQFEPGDIEPHRRYLAEVPEEVTAERLKKYRLDPEVLQEVPPIICDQERLVPDLKEKPLWVYPLAAETLEDLKNWAGIPNEIALRNLEMQRQPGGHCRVCSLVDDVALYALPKTETFEFEKLDDVERRAVRQAANNLLYGYADPEEVRRVPYRAVVDFMLERAQELWLALVPDLIVCPDDRVEFANFTTLYFNNVLVYGNGEIAPGNQVKIDAHQIRHVA